ncbi:MAG TPA: hypothetical protein VF059_05100 [Casimicrobiaceae bacterium]
MADRLDPNRGACTEPEYRAARTELEQLLGGGAEIAEGHRVDELLELIESYEATTRFVPDWSGESYRNAA